ncbi:hypothetical protein DFH08DRAFT_808135 [Mycena albidolilacea]|uniref:Uncharacterized protein n=1 Tax=Mycena albidolilacea TaxID=1033008 RepID=A0AAD7A3Y8_9AGAR|nr:hypothetical protein DFH08DRAFT_808135 [Mycena albidolilacea]
MFSALRFFFLLLASQGSHVGAASLKPTDAQNFDIHTLTPPSSSAGDLVFNWHDAEDSGDHNSISTRIFQLTDGGNSSISDNVRISGASTGQYVVEGMAVQFNDTHFTQDASTTPWIAVFSCTESSKAGNTSDLISNAERLGAHAIIAYTVAGVISFCNLTTDTPGATIPIYTTEL